MDEIHDHQEVFGKSHLVDDAELIIHAASFLVSNDSVPLGKCFFAELSQIRCSSLSFRHVKGRELVLTESKLHIAAVRNDPRIFNSAGEIS